MTRIVVIDTETTGKEVSRDQIIEVSLRFGLEEHAEFIGVRIKPDVPIHPETIKVHGIKDEDLVDCQAFAQACTVFMGPLQAADVIVGFNVGFDLDIIQAELARAGLPKLDLGSKVIVDALRLWHHVEPRTLTAAYEKFTGQVLTNAHAARVDVEATAQVLVAMLERFGLTGKAWPELAAIADPFDKRRNWIGPSSHIQWDGAHAVLAFGRHRGTRLDQVDPDFLEWVLRRDFPPHVHEICGLMLGIHEYQTRPVPSAADVLIDTPPKSIEEILVEKFPRPIQQEAA